MKLSEIKNLDLSDLDHNDIEATADERGRITLGASYAAEEVSRGRPRVRCTASQPT